MDWGPWRPSVTMASSIWPAISSAIFHRTLLFQAGGENWGHMKARQILANTAFGPDTLKALYQAFDEAWDTIAPTISQRAEALEVARTRLANIVLVLARNGSNDPEQIKNAAIQMWSANPNKLAG